MTTDSDITFAISTSKRILLSDIFPLHLLFISLFACRLIVCYCFMHELSSCVAFEALYSIVAINATHAYRIINIYNWKTFFRWVLYASQWATANAQIESADYEGEKWMPKNTKIRHSIVMNSWNWSSVS